MLHALQFPYKYENRMRPFFIVYPKLVLLENLVSWLGLSESIGLSKVFFTELWKYEIVLLSLTLCLIDLNIIRDKEQINFFRPISKT